jgi:hypothetical protein
MYFKSTLRKHPELGQFCPYYRLVESYRNLENRICHRTLLNVGFLPELKPEHLNIIQKKLNELVPPLVRAIGIKELARCLRLVPTIISKQNYNPKKVVVFYLYLQKNR